MRVQSAPAPQIKNNWFTEKPVTGGVIRQSPAEVCSDFVSISGTAAAVGASSAAAAGALGNGGFFGAVGGLAGGAVAGAVAGAMLAPVLQNSSRKLFGADKANGEDEMGATLGGGVVGGLTGALCGVAGNFGLNPGVAAVGGAAAFGLFLVGTSLFDR